MRLADARFLLDLSVLMALSDEEHQGHRMVQGWFDRDGCRDWGTCALTQTGVIRLMANPKVRGFSVRNTEQLLALLTGHPGHSLWPMSSDWTALTSTFTDRIFGRQQVTDACWRGIAVNKSGVLVTMDGAISRLAGPLHRRSLLVLQREPDVN
jgi:predicted nucleic acid-binding protein